MTQRTMTHEELDEFKAQLNAVFYGYTKPFYWIEMPDGRRSHMITRGKLVASLAVLRMNYPHINLELIGKLPLPKKRGKVEP